MLSGLTSQLGGLMSSVRNKGGQEGDTTNTEGGGTEEQSAAAAADNDNNTASKSSRSGSTSNADTAGGAGGGGITAGITKNMPSLTSVKANLPSWLGGGGPTTATTDEEAQSGETTISSDKINNDVSNSDAAVAADEEPTTGSTAAGEKVKNLGSFLFSGIKGVGQKIKDTPNLLIDFQVQQDLFVKAKGGLSGAATPPWVGHPKEEELKSEILGLSGDRRHFVRSPPQSVTFQWSLEESLPIAKAILKEDPNLEKMRYELVPKVVSEDNFWRNYFYRVSLLKESLGENTKAAESGDEDAEGPDEVDADLERELNEELKGFEVIKKDSTKAASSSSKPHDDNFDLK